MAAFHMVEEECAGAVRRCHYALHDKHSRQELRCIRRGRVIASRDGASAQRASMGPPANTVSTLLVRVTPTCRSQSAAFNALRSVMSCQ